MTKCNLAHLMKKIIQKNICAGLIYSHGFTLMMIISIGLGISKGIRSVYTALVIPGYVPLHKLGSATGLQMVMNGIFLLIFGPLLGNIYNIQCCICFDCTSNSDLHFREDKGRKQKLR